MTTIIRRQCRGCFDYEAASLEDMTSHRMACTSGRGHRMPNPIIQCACGREVVCDSFTNTCDCDRDYNMSGQLLAPRSHWGEETGESVSDILAIS